MTRILVVDDSAVDRKLAGGLLSKVNGWRVDYANDGHEALSQLRREVVDLILTDLQMPEMTGLELVNQVKEVFPQIPVVLMTAQGSEAIAVEALRQGAASYVPKKQLADILIETVRQVVTLVAESRTKKALMSKLTSVRYQFRMGNDTALLSTLVAHVQGIVAEMGILSEGERLRTGVALEEALLNAAYHGNLEVSSRLREEDHSTFYELARERARMSPYAGRNIFVDVSIDQTGLKYVVTDEGPGFDPRCLPDPTDPANLERPCGRGVLLMRTFMDEIEYNDRGNRVTMSKRATLPRAESVSQNPA